MHKHSKHKTAQGQGTTHLHTTGNSTSTRHILSVLIPFCPSTGSFSPTPPLTQDPLLCAAACCSVRERSQVHVVVCRVGHIHSPANRGIMRPGGMFFGTRHIWSPSSQATRLLPFFPFGGAGLPLPLGGGLAFGGGALLFGGGLGFSPFFGRAPFGGAGAIFTCVGLLQQQQQRYE